MKFSPPQLPPGASVSILSKARRESSPRVSGHCQSNPKSDLESTRQELGAAQRSSAGARPRTSNHRREVGRRGNLHLPVGQRRESGESSHDEVERAANAAHRWSSENDADEWERSIGASLSSFRFTRARNLLDDQRRKHEIRSGHNFSRIALSHPISREEARWDCPMLRTQRGRRSQRRRVVASQPEANRWRSETDPARHAAKVAIAEQQSIAGEKKEQRT